MSLACGNDGQEGNHSGRAKCEFSACFGGPTRASEGAEVVIGRAGGSDDFFFDKFCGAGRCGKEPAQDVATNRVGQSGKAVEVAGPSAEGGTSAPQKPLELPKIIFPVLTRGR